jgi:hypothetical protein
MRCFYHPDAEAVGICKSCQKGLCADSAVDVGDGLACQGCAERVRKLNATLGTADAMCASWSAFLGPGMLLVGALFVAFGILVLAAWDDAWGAAFFVGMGLVFGATPGRQLVLRLRRS